MAAATGLSARSRVRRVLMFLGVVWSLGGAFLALQAGVLELSSLTISRWAPSSIVLPRPAQGAPAHCSQVLNALPAPAQEAKMASAASHDAWLLGYLVGFVEGQVISGMITRDEGEQRLRRDSMKIASALGIPAPVLLEYKRPALALRDFARSLEEDPQCIAAALDSRNSPQHAAVYKFGAALGVASVYRRVSPQFDDVLEAELRLYGSAAGLPTELYTHPFHGDGADSNQVVQTVVHRVQAYLTAPK